MAVSDLTNTTWVFNSSIDLSTTGVTPIVEGEVQYKSITFTSNNRNYVKLIVGSTNGVRWNVFAYGYEGFSADDVYMSGYWTDEAFRTIEITGGTDVTNASLISWLEANATQQTTPTGKTQIGNRAITKKTFGTREITKEVVNGVTIYEKASSGYTINIIAGREVTDATGPCKTYFKFNSNSVSTSDYDGYVSEYGVLTGPSTYTNVTSMAFVSTTNNSEHSSSVIYGSDSYHFSTSVVVIQINSSGNININGLENTGPQ